MRYRKKPIAVEAFVWTGDRHQREDPEWIVEAIKVGRVGFVAPGTSDVQLYIDTLDGRMLANIGDWIIRGIAGEVYPCREDIFKETYDPVD